MAFGIVSTGNDERVSMPTESSAGNVAHCVDGATRELLAELKALGHGYSVYSTRLGVPMVTRVIFLIYFLILFQPSVVVEV